MADQMIEACRRATVDRTRLDVDRLMTKGEFYAVLATPAPVVERSGVKLSLSHEPGAAVFPEQSPLYVEHDLGQLQAGVVREQQISGENTTGLVVLAHRHRGEGSLAADIRDKIVDDLSIRAAVTEYRDGPDGSITGTRWRPLEYSLTGEGLDPAAGVIRSRRNKTVDDKTVDDKEKGTGTVEPHQARVEAIRGIFTGLEGDAFTAARIAALEGTDSVEVVRGQVLELMKANAAKAVTGTATAGDDQVDKYLGAVEQHLAFRSGLVEPDKRRAAELEQRKSPIRSYSLLEVCRGFLRSVNQSDAGLSREGLVSRALFATRSGIVGTAAGDLTNVLAANVNKALGMGYDEAPETWRRWTGRDSAPDFKAASRPVLSAFSDLDNVGDGEYEYGALSDKAESFTLQRFGKLFSIGRTAILNDDLAALGRLPRMMGRAAARKVGDSVYSVLTANAAMGEDSVALFHTATHGNLATSGAISVATLNAGRLAMGTQTDVSGDHTIQVPPRYLLTPLAIQGTGEAILAAAHNPATASGVEPVPGYIGNLDQVAEARLDAASATAWYLVADPAAFDTVLVAFLDGIETPMIEEHDAGPTRDGVIYKVRHEFQAYAGDWRTMYKNNGS